MKTAATDRPRFIRQGDVLLVSRPAPAESTRIESRGLRLPGERSGHEHLLEAEVHDTPSGRMLHLAAPATLRTVRTDTGAAWDERHAPVEVPAGWWEPFPQRQYVPASRPASRSQFD